jgi:hypothetical protein
MPLWAVGRAGNVDMFFVRTWTCRALQAIQRENGHVPMCIMMWHVATRALVISHEKKCMSGYTALAAELFVDMERRALEKEDNM